MKLSEQKTKNSNISIDLGISMVVAFVVLLTLKITMIPALPWLAVFAPLIFLLAMFCMFVGVIIILLIGYSVLAVAGSKLK